MPKRKMYDAGKTENRETAEICRRLVGEDRSYKEVAHLSGVSPQRISRICRGESKPSRNTILYLTQPEVHPRGNVTTVEFMRAAGYMSRKTDDKEPEKAYVRVVNIRLEVEKKLYCDIPIAYADDIVKVMGQEMKTLDRELVACMLLNTRNQVIAVNYVSMGSLDGSIVTGRELFKAAVLANARSIILVHNHTSGDITPSKEDIEVTRKIAICGTLMDIQLLDHVIIGGYTGNSYSFLENGMMPDVSVQEILYVAD